MNAVSTRISRHCYTANIYSDNTLPVAPAAAPSSGFRARPDWSGDGSQPGEAHRSLVNVIQTLM